MKINLRKIWEEKKIDIILVLILIFSLGTKVWKIWYPDEYIFDEIYAAYTAEQYSLGNEKAFIWDYPADEGFAYNWDHPPLGRELMSIPIKILGISSYARRIVPLIAGVLLSLVVFAIGKLLFPKSPFIALVAAFLVACDGLVFALSRIGLVDSLLTLFITTSIYFLLKKEYWWSAIFWGAAASCKWTGVFLIFYIGIFLLMESNWTRKKIFSNLFLIIKRVLSFLAVGSVVYLIAYLPVFYHFGIKKFIEIQQQAYWYHSRLEATHPAQSPALSWPLNLRPVWFWVDYQEETIANIYALGNPLIFWCGILGVIFTLALAIKTRNKKLWYLVLAYPACWIQWIVSPRIMFLYHYLPAVPFLCLSLAFFLWYLTKINKWLKILAYLLIFFCFITFCYFYPFLSGIAIDKEMVDSFRWLDSWR